MKRPLFYSKQYESFIFINKVFFLIINVIYFAYSELAILLFFWIILISDYKCKQKHIIFEIIILLLYICNNIQIYNNKRIYERIVEAK